MGRYEKKLVRNDIHPLGRTDIHLGRTDIHLGRNEIQLGRNDIGAQWQWGETWVNIF